MNAFISSLAAMATAAGGKIILALLVLIIGNILIKSICFSVYCICIPPWEGISSMDCSSSPSLRCTRP